MNNEDLKDYFKDLGFVLNDIEIGISPLDSNKPLEVGEWDFEELNAKFIVDKPFNSGFDGDLGYATFQFIDAAQIPASNIRDIADFEDFALYEAVSSVRIFKDQYEASRATFTDYKKYDTYEATGIASEMKAVMEVLLEKELAVVYPEGYERYTFEGKPYHDETIDTWGKILVLDDLKFHALINKPIITELLVKLLFNTLKYLGNFDWLIVNPDVSDEYLIEHGYPVTNSEEYGQFLEKMGFRKTQGKLENGRLCYCLQLR